MLSNTYRHDSLSGWWIILVVSVANVIYSFRISLKRIAMLERKLHWELQLPVVRECTIHAILLRHVHMCACVMPICRDSLALYRVPLLPLLPLSRPSCHPSSIFSSPTGHGGPRLGDTSGTNAQHTSSSGEAAFTETFSLKVCLCGLIHSFIHSLCDISANLAS